MRVRKKKKEQKKYAAADIFFINFLSRVGMFASICIQNRSNSLGQMWYLRDNNMRMVIKNSLEEKKPTCTCRLSVILIFKILIIYKITIFIPTVLREPAKK